MKRLHWAGIVTTVAVLAGLGGCSDPAPGNTGGSSGSGANTAGTTGTTGGTGSSTGGTSGTQPATQLSGAAAFTILSATDAPAGTAPAPAKFGATGAGCSVCHGNNGEGVDLLGPEIRHIDPTYGTWVVRHGRSGSAMVAFPVTASTPSASLSDAELADIMTWLGGLPKPTTPQGLYKDFCGNCHGPTNPTGGAVAVNVSGLTVADVNMFVRDGEGTDPSMRTAYMPKFSTTALTDAELAQIQTFIMAK